MKEDKPESAVAPFNILAPRHLMIIGSLIAARGVLADVTVQEQMSLDVSILKAHTTETTITRARRSVTSTCSRATA